MMLKNECGLRLTAGHLHLNPYPCLHFPLNFPSQIPSLNLLPLFILLLPPYHPQLNFKMLSPPKIFLKGRHLLPFAPLAPAIVLSRRLAAVTSLAW
jgi:hypothetical protein